MYPTSRLLLYSMPAYGFGLIILDPNGMLYLNQTAGTSCNQPSARGHFLPIMRETNNWCRTCRKYFYSDSQAIECTVHTCSCRSLSGCAIHDNCPIKIQQALLGDLFLQDYNCGCQIGLYPDSVEYINKILSKNVETAYLEIDPALVEKSHEAWLYVKIVPERISTESWAHTIDGEAATNGVLTWSNSD